ALVRPGSDTAFLQKLGVELAVGDLGDRDSLVAAMRDATVVYHCAARVRDWGPWSAFQDEVVDTTARVLDAAQTAGVGRFLHASAISAYGHPDGYARADREITEEDALGQNPWIGDYYSLSKTKADELVLRSPLPWTVVRPSAFYGPRDRALLPRVIAAF